MGLSNKKIKDKVLEEASFIDSYLKYVRLKKEESKEEVKRTNDGDYNVAKALLIMRSCRLHQ